MRSYKSACLATLLACSVATQGLAQQAAPQAIPEGDWRTINRDLAATRYSPLDDITRANVASLQTAWSYPLQAFNNAVPLVVDGIMYFPAQNRVVALDAATGAEIWVHERPQPEGQTSGFGGGFSGRGLAYWPGDGRRSPRLLLTAGTKLVALDARNGRPVRGFGTRGEVDPLK